MPEDIYFAICSLCDQLIMRSEESIEIVGDTKTIAHKSCVEFVRDDQEELG